jgi:aminoglycoside N3'-acetyltransferase
MPDDNSSGILYHASHRYPLAASRSVFRMSHSPVTYRDIVLGLQQLAVMRGATVEVHSSLSAFGWVEGGAPTVIKALMDVLSPDGTLIMSAYPVSPPVPLTDEDRQRGITWKVRILPTDSSERTGMGLIADTFRQRADVVYGSDFFRTCAWGRDAEWHCDGYRALLAVDGWCLLFGVGIDRCSSMHAAESIPIPSEISACWAIPDHVQRAYDPQLWAIGYGGTPEDAWQKIWNKAEAHGLIRHGRIGQAACHYFKARSVVEIYKRWRQADPYDLYGVPHPQ